MDERPRRALEYSSEQLELVRSTCLYVATRLGDLTDEIVVVGGLVPSLLIDQAALPDGTSRHVGTMDLDVGLNLALLDEGRYRTLTERLRDAGFVQDETGHGRRTRQRWRVTGRGSVTVDFLIPPSRETDQAGKLRDIERDFAAIIAPGLRLAFQDRRRILIEGTTILGEKAAREVWVCGPGAFVVLKALAFLGRGENKDAYDLYYVVRNFGAGVDDVAACLRPMLEDLDARRAINVLRADFLDHQAIGPRRVAEFLQGRRDQEIQADVVGFIKALIDRC
ncbi:MAG: nucleotidyl transferase AbiEii/AbiGii toxin family protein [Acidobacteriota bacterium]